jgi:hypothetical protein
MGQRAILAAGVLLGAGVALGATVFRTDLAQATGLVQTVRVTNTPAQAIPVREQNLDANGYIKVHEQGVVQVQPSEPITGGATGINVLGGHDFNFETPQTASALSIRMTAGVRYLEFFIPGGYRPVFFHGPGECGNASIVLALARPIRFDRIKCTGPETDRCSVSWIGNSAN